jgi:ribosome-associated translation inhibitor RaiA
MRREQWKRESGSDATDLSSLQNISSVVVSQSKRRTSLAIILGCTHDLEQPHEHEDIYVAIRDAIDAVRDQLEECVRRRREEIRLHVSMP